ncbi:hypothetical protein CW740_02230 [Kangiella profundi]|uniref:Uncharacterized protein n=1 Tax=Kangiella profundi TaxID=1561924 RepID=A0A2K9ACK7_9GAMM|nr:hypothetical protein [Kangiella profundi]AUD78116.1 hypothetical protein CW740_02230 [Kangiella profundi]GGF05197.1 hypothetical protein GCM10011356_18500 [Kangiella profundi]
MQKWLLLIIIALSLSACSNEEKESDKLLSDYKQQQLDKAKQVEQQMQKRVDNLDQELKEATENKEDDQPF